MSLESNQLVGGLIPKQTPCPFYRMCAAFDEKICPTERKPKGVNFSCAMARLLNRMTEEELANQSKPNV